MGGTCRCLATESPVHSDPWRDNPCTLRVILGPRDDWVAGAANLLRTNWTVSTRADRVGIRLEGHSLAREPAYKDRELPSEGTVRGAIQVPPDGQAVLFGPDHPLTGGYPVVAVVIDADLDATAQLRPGRLVCFRPGG
ncbi:MAG TPA: hypothetical protein VES01_11030 [Dermatophilaceae bacterium]|nr:hypothetical protein [Dermatophilaceae bacterium]